jgi:hypothetical protein
MMPDAMPLERSPSEQQHRLSRAGCASFSSVRLEADPHNLEWVGPRNGLSARAAKLVPPHITS